MCIKRATRKAQAREQPRMSPDVCHQPRPRPTSWRRTMIGPEGIEHMGDVIAGIDLAAGRGTTEVAVVEMAEDDALPRYRPHQPQKTITDDDILAVVAEAHPVVVAIDAPLSLPASVASSVRGEALGPTISPLALPVGATNAPQAFSR